MGYICFEKENGLYSYSKKKQRLPYLSSKEKYIASTEKLKIKVFWKTLTLTCKTQVEVMILMKK